MRADRGGALDAPVDVDREADAELLGDGAAPPASCCGRPRGVPGSRAICSSVPWVKALIGLNDRLPQSLTQMSSRMRGRTGALKPAAAIAAAERLAPLGGAAVGLAEIEAVAVDVLDDARLDDLAGRIDDAADRALGPDHVPLPAARIDRSMRRFSHGPGSL